MIRKACEADPKTCPKCGGTMKVITFVTDFGAVDCIIDHLKLRSISFDMGILPVKIEKRHDFFSKILE
jgi:hypothetical protein